MIESLIALIITLVILYIVYLVVGWLLGLFPVPAVFVKILDIVFAVVAGVAILRFVGAFLGFGKYL